jgi:hypothetical protein
MPAERLTSRSTPIHSASGGENRQTFLVKAILIGNQQVRDLAGGNLHARLGEQGANDRLTHATVKIEGQDQRFHTRPKLALIVWWRRGQVGAMLGI